MSIKLVVNKKIEIWTNILKEYHINSHSLKKIEIYKSLLNS